MSIQHSEAGPTSEGEAVEATGGTIERRPGSTVLALVSLGLAAGYAWIAFGIPGGSMSDPGPGMWPRTVGIAWVAISIIALAESFRVSPTAAADLLPSGPKLKVVILFSIATLLYVIAIPILGIYFTSSAYAAFVISLMRNKIDLKAAIYGIVFGVGSSFIFVEILTVRLPAFPWS